jgi:CPA1 family monovalent cation:H+ antiporter
MENFFLIAAQSNATETDLNFTAYVWLLLVASGVAILGRRIRIPYALALVITGLLIGAPHLLPQAHLDPHLLLTVFLPPLLFETTINIRAEALKKDGKPIAIYALGGTFISTFVVGGLTAWLLKLPLPVALVFGALISTTDPVSVIAVFKRLGVGKRLSLLMEGESLFNDGAAVVLFGVLVGAAMGQKVSVSASILQFITTVLGGAVVGLGIGAVASRLTREFDDHLLEITLTTIVAFGSYLCAEAFHVSGVIAVVIAGLTVGNYGMQTGMSPTTRLAVHSFWEYAGFVVNSIVFLLLGIEVTFVNLWQDIGLVAGAIGIVVAGRAIAIYSLSPLINGLKGNIPAAFQHVLFWGGLRGALSMALVLGLPPNFPQRSTLVVLAFGVVLFSLLAQGLSIGPLLKWLGLTQGRSEAADYQRLAGEITACQAAIREVDRMQASGLFSRPVAEEVKKDYTKRREELETQIEALHLSDEALKERQTGEARRVALLAEKSALLDAQRNGLLDEADYRELIERIDARLAEIMASKDTH